MQEREDEMENSWLLLKNIVFFFITYAHYYTLLELYPWKDYFTMKVYYFVFMEITCFFHLFLILYPNAGKLQMKVRLWNCNLEISETGQFWVLMMDSPSLCLVFSILQPFLHWHSQSRYTLICWYKYLLMYLISAMPISRRRQWQPTPVHLPGKSHGQRSLVGYSPWVCKESDTTER